jgi:hypothetical protein
VSYLPKQVFVRRLTKAERERCRAYLDEKARERVARTSPASRSSRRTTRSTRKANSRGEN